MIQENENGFPIQKQKIVQIITEFVGSLNFNKTVKAIQMEMSMKQIKENQKENHQMIDESEEHYIECEKVTQKEKIEEQPPLEEQKEIQKQSNQQNKTTNLSTEKMIGQKDILSLLNKGGSFSQLLTKCQTILTNQNEINIKEQQQQIQIPKLLRIVQCSWAKLTKYKLPIYKTMKIQCSKKVAFLKMCPSDCFCCAIDENNTIKIIDIVKREVRQEKRVKYQGQDKNNPTFITALEWINWESFVIGDSMGNVSVYNPLNLKVIDEYKKLHDSMITALTSLNGFIYSCGVDKVIKKVKKNDEKQLICSGYSMMLKTKYIDNYLIGVDQQQKSIYILDEITQKQTLLFTLQNKNKRIGAVQVSNEGNLFVAIEKGYPQIYQIQISTRRVSKRVKVQKQKSCKVSITQFFKGAVLAISIANNQNIQYYSTKNWNMIYEHLGQNEKHKKIEKYKHIGNTENQKLVYANGRWVELLDVEKLDLVERKIKKQQLNSFFNARNARESPGFLSLLQNFQLNYHNLF